MDVVHARSLSSARTLWHHRDRPIAMQEKLDLRIVAGLFRAATGGATWDEALAPMREALGGNHHSLWLRAERDLRPVAFLAETQPAEIMENYTAHYGALDPLAPRASAAPRGTTVLSDDLVPFDALEGTSFYNEWMIGNEMRRFIGATCRLPTDGENFVAVAFQRPPGSEAFDARDRELMTIFTSQLSAAVEVWWRVRAVEERARDLETLVDAVDVGMGVVGPDGRMSVYNRTLGRTLAQRDGLLLDAAGRLVAVGSSGPGLRRALHTAMTECLATSLEIRRPSGRRAYRVAVAPVDDEARGAPAGHRAVLVRVHDPSVSDRILELQMSEKFGLTPAESAIALRLTRGEGLGDIAGSTGRSTGTTRNLLKRAFAKTGTHRQAALVALVLALERDSGR